MGKKHTARSVLVGALAGCVLSALPGCSEHDGAMGPLGTVELALSRWDINRSWSDAKSDALSYAIARLQQLDSNTQQCLGSEGVYQSYLTSTCNTTLAQLTHTTPRPVIEFKQASNLSSGRATDGLARFRPPRGSRGGVGR